MPTPTLIQPLKLLKLVSASRISEAEALIAADSPAPKALRHFLMETQLCVYFYALTADTPILNRLPEHDRDALRKAWQRQCDANKAYLEMLVELQGRLATKGVEIVLLKGLSTAVRFAGGSDRRFMWDADILVHPRQVKAVIDAAGKLGLSGRGSRLPTWMLNLLNLHALEVSHRGRAIDIHWCFRRRPGYRIDYRRIRADTQRVMIEGHTFQTLAEEDALAFALLEIAGDLERSHFKMRTLWDVYLMLGIMDGTISWQRFFGLRRDEGLLRLSVNSLALCLLVLDCEAEFPALAQALDQHRAQLLVVDRNIALDMLSRPQQDLSNRYWYARLQPQPQPVYWLWWLFTAPLRFAITRNL